MKASNLIKLIEHDINVPKFIVISEKDVDIEDKVEKFSPCKKVSIRSSHSSEDTQEKSNAGKFLTFLNIEKDRLSYVKEVFEYGKNISGGEMRVIVQEMVYSDYSGVIFTSNPQGLLNEIVINVGYGLGDKVVENKINTTTYYKNKHNEKGYYELTEGSPILKDNIVESLFVLGNNIENIYKCPMDIEFSIKNDIIYCLQARPITTFKSNETVILDNSNIIENYPGVVCPLTSDFVSMVYSLAFKSAVSEIASKSQMGEWEYVFNNMVAENNSRMYYKIDNWYKLLEHLPFSNHLLNIWEEMIGISNMNYVKSRKSILSKLTIGLKFINVLMVTQKKMDDLDKHFKQQIDTYRNKITNCNMNESLLLYDEIKQDFGGKWGITLYNDLYAFIFMALAKKFENRIVQGICGIESTQPIELLNKISEEQKNKNQDKVNELKLEFIKLYGDRCIEELKLETKTLRINPLLLNNMIPNTPTEKTISSQDKSKIRFFEKQAKKGIKGREVSRLNRSRLFGVVRDIFIHIGKEFVKLNYITEYEDIFYLRYSEIERILNLGKECGIDIKLMIEERKSIIRTHSELPTYDRLIFSSEPFNKYPLNINNSKVNFQNSDLRGIPVSHGVFRGEAIVIDKIDLSIDVSNKIIITESTDPGWVFLIENASAIITERGSLLSHTSIVTRELEKPAIVGVSNITKIIRTGDMLEIDGTTGKVKIL